MSRPEMLRCAQHRVDSEGLGALNLRKLADRMGISAMTSLPLLRTQSGLVVRDDRDRKKHGGIEYGELPVSHIL